MKLDLLYSQVLEREAQCATRGGGGHTGGASREQAQPSRCGADRAGPHGHVALLGVMAEYT